MLIVPLLYAITHYELGGKCLYKTPRGARIREEKVAGKIDAAREVHLLYILQIHSSRSGSELHDCLQSGGMSCSVTFVSVPSTYSLKSRFTVMGGQFVRWQVWVAHFVCRLIAISYTSAHVLLCPPLITHMHAVMCQVPRGCISRCIYVNKGLMGEPEEGRVSL